MAPATQNIEGLPPSSELAAVDDTPPLAAVGSLECGSADRPNPSSRLPHSTTPEPTSGVFARVYDLEDERSARIERMLEAQAENDAACQLEVVRQLLHLYDTNEDVKATWTLQIIRGQR